MHSENKVFAYKELAVWLEGLLHEYQSLSVGVSVDSKLNGFLNKQYAFNPWITQDFSVKSINSALHFLREFPVIDGSEAQKSRNIGFIPFNNIPLSGLYACLQILLTNHKVWIKDTDSQISLLKVFINQLCTIYPPFKEQIFFVPVFPKDIDGWIVCVSERKGNVTMAKYFEHKTVLFLHRPVTIAALTGNETDAELSNLAESVFVYWGFHPDNTRKLLVPKGYSFNRMFELMEPFSYVYNHNKYANNYDYHKSVFLMDRKPFLDNGFVVLYETQSNEVPVGCLGHAEYSSLEDFSEIDGKLDTNLPVVIRQRINTSVFTDFENSYLQKYSRSIDEFLGKTLNFN